MSGNYKKMLAEVFAWLIFLWVLWVYSGGPERADRLDKPFLKPPSPLNTNGVFGGFSELPTIPSAEKSLRIGNQKDYSDASLSFNKDKNSEGEYIEITVLPTSKRPLNLTGWKIKGVIDSEPRIIGTGAYTFKQGIVNDENNILIYPGEKALIIPGDSPVGASFKLNKCIGYLEQFQTFIPHLPQNCPHFGLDSKILDNECNTFAGSIMRCNAYTKEFPSYVSKSCGETINKRLNYNSCVSEHIEDVGFRKGEWRVYIGGKETLGSENGDLISIFDAEGNLVDTIFYSK